MADTVWEAVMQDGYIASDNESKSSEFQFSLNENGVPYNLNTWKIERNKNDGYPYITLPKPATSINSIRRFIALANGEYGRGTPEKYLEIELTEDIDFNDLREFGVAYNWEGFTGTWYIHFDGKNHTIDNINYSGTNQWGFFEKMFGSIKNLKLTNMHIESTNNVAGLILTASSDPDREIRNVHISAYLSSTQKQCAGFVGDYSGSSNNANFIRECSFTGIIRGGTYAVLNSWYRSSTSATVIYLLNCLIRVEMYAPKVYLLGHNNDIAVNCGFLGIWNGSTFVKIGEKSSVYLYYSYIVAKAGSSSLIDSGEANILAYYDKTVASAAGITVSAIPLTTSELQDTDRMRSYGLPS